MRGLTGVLALATLMGACRGAGWADSPPTTRLDGIPREPSAQEVEALEALFADGADSTRGECFWAGWSLAQHHALRALDERAALAGDDHPDRTGHAVAALHFAGRAPEGRSAAATQDTPADWAGSDFADVTAGLEILRLTLFDALGFHERVERLREVVPGSGDPLAVRRLLARAGLRERLRPHVWLALFEERRAGDPQGAFAFAAAALKASDETPGSLPQGEVTGIEDWIERGAPFVFRCPECGQPAVPQLRACPNDQVRLERFVARPRP